MTDDLVKRLRLWGEHGLTNTLSDLVKAADRIEAQAAEIERLREALERIVSLEEDFESNSAMTAHEWQMFYVARAALGETE